MLGSRVVLGGVVLDIHHTAVRERLGASDHQYTLYAATFFISLVSHAYAYFLYLYYSFFLSPVFFSKQNGALEITCLMLRRYRLPSMKKAQPLLNLYLQITHHLLFRLPYKAVGYFLSSWGFGWDIHGAMMASLRHTKKPARGGLLHSEKNITRARRVTFSNRT